MKAPPGISDAVFATALQGFANVVGKEWVFTSDEDLVAYRDAYSPLRGEPDLYVASAAVAPSSVEQVQAIVRIANKHLIPLFAFSTGRNLGYGGAGNTYSGCVTVDLKRMDKILEVNEDDAYILVEPGVSFYKLYEYFQQHDIKLIMSAPEPGWGSPIGNALDHGVSHPRGDNFAAACGMEVVLPTGELVRTGMGGLPNTASWQRYAYGFGPWIDGIFSQSNFGIVTKMGFWLQPVPDKSIAIGGASFKYDSLEALVDVSQALRNSGLCRPTGGAGSPLMSSGLPEAKALLAKAGGGSAQEWEQLARDKNVPLFTANAGVWGRRYSSMPWWSTLGTNSPPFRECSLRPARSSAGPWTPTRWSSDKKRRSVCRTCPRFTT
jgi:(+)-pinoresinol hydroxylase